VTDGPVAFLIDYFWPNEIGGAERSARTLARALAQSGVRVVVLTPRYSGQPEEHDQGVDIIRLPFPQRVEPGRLARRAWLANPALQLFYGALAAWHAYRRKIRLLHVQNSQMVMAGAVASLLARRAMLVTIRDLAYLPQQHRGEGRAATVKEALDARYAVLERRLKLFAIRRASRIVFVSKGLQELYAAADPIWVRLPAEVVYNIGPEVAASSQRDAGTQTVLFVGKLSVGKVLQVLYQAIAEVAKQMPGVRFELIGQPGAGWQPAPDGIRDVVTMSGRLSEAEVLARMAEAAVLVSPSLWPEPLSRVLLEAMSRGLPVVATAVGGTREAVGDDGGVLVPPGDPIALASAVVRVLRDPLARQTLRDCALARYRRLFTQEAVLPRILDVYRSAI
jgi:glycosyltransferase involved in cell wall biosynthesis